MNKEDYKYIPLAAVGLALGVGETVIKPLLVNGAKLAGRTALNLLDMAMPADPPPRAVQAAAITYYSSGGEHGDNNT